MLLSDKSKPPHLLLRALLLLARPVLSDQNAMIPLVRLQRQLLQRLEILALKLAHLPPEHRLRRGRRIDAARLDCDDRVPPVLQEVVRVQRHDARLVRLRDVGEHAVDHAHEHPVLEGVAGVLDDGDDVRAALGHVEQIPAGTVREFHGVHVPLGTDDVGHVGDGRAGRGAEVQDLGAGFDPYVVDTPQDGGGDFLRRRGDVCRAVSASR